MTSEIPPPSVPQPQGLAKIRALLITFWREWRGFLIFLLVMFSFRSAIADWNDVPTGSMLPTILIGDRILVDKLAYDLKLPFTTVRVSTWGQPRRGDIVVFYSPADGVRLVKRVIGVPGDRIGMINNHLVINGIPLRYEERGETNSERGGAPQELRVEQLDGKAHLMMVSPDRPSMKSFAAVQVPPDAFLMMGDNRDNSNDSRYIGFVPRSEILGRASRVVFSLDPGHWYAPRADRFLTVLD
jgi:signal peptidase I